MTLVAPPETRDLIARGYLDAVVVQRFLGLSEYEKDWLHPIFTREVSNPELFNAEQLEALAEITRRLAANLRVFGREIAWLIATFDEEHPGIQPSQLTIAHWDGSIFHMLDKKMTQLISEIPLKERDQWAVPLARAREVMGPRPEDDAQLTDWFEGVQLLVAMNEVGIDIDRLCFDKEDEIGPINNVALHPPNTFDEYHPATYDFAYGQVCFLLELLDRNIVDIYPKRLALREELSLYGSTLGTSLRPPSAVPAGI
jgi:hypothetical protein